MRRFDRLFTRCWLAGSVVLVAMATIAPAVEAAVPGKVGW